MSTEETKESSSAEAVDRPLFASMVFNPKMIIGIVLMYAGLGIPFLLKTQSDIILLLKNQSPTILGVASAFIGLSLAFGEFSKIQRLRREERFIDVDEKRGEIDNKLQARILHEIKNIKSQSDNLAPEKIEEMVSKIVERKSVENAEMFDTFENYFNEIRGVLIEQAHTADKKASILLDKGTAYSKGGITFFITSIVAWQVLSWLTEFKEQYIYGIVSCSLLFIFIEFLAAWFLKQYRHFVDTSTYHIKVKSIFDKYMMSYLAIKTLGGNSSNEEQKYQAMLKVLEEDIKWPESYLLKNGDISFAKEALETMTHFAKAMKSEVKSQSK
ncbi:MAG: hypothetical protein MI794_19540 [Pseudomonadales bacterium]|nr:hypothetical protein [Pseudomonadales bacterium]